MTLLFLVLFSLVLSLVSANTEIVNVVAAVHPAVQVDAYAREWTVLNAASNEARFEVQPALFADDTCNDSLWYECTHDAWMVLQLDDSQWSQFTKYTLRISWPASSPADFSIQVFTPPELVSLIASTNSTSISNQPTENLYARVRVMNTGVPTPSKHPFVIQNVAFIAILEPLYFGVLPQTLLPTILCLFPLILIAGFVVFPRIYEYLEKYAASARKEMAGRRD